MASTIEARLQGLGDLELALLVSMIAEEHCIVSTNTATTTSLSQELSFTCAQTFGVKPVVIECSPETTVDDFTNSMLIDLDELKDNIPGVRDGMDRPTFSVDFSPSRERSPGRFGSFAGDRLENKHIADVIIASGLDTAHDAVQLQALELLRSKRIFTRSAMHVAPKDMLFIAVLSRPQAKLCRHFNDVFAMSHIHDDEDGHPHFDSQSGKALSSAFFLEDVKVLRQQMENVFLTAEMAQYLHNVVVFMRNSRYIKGGVTATATRQMRSISRALAPLHGIDYVPPSLVALAARKIYPHRLVLATHENEKSLLWGSDPRAVKELLEGVTVEDAIEAVLASIEAPL
ncbi:hypothetical protein CLAFUW4_02913 [Fulvia fulva]|uniref:magnesium chelatase n=1 Tax=Passalora fulva TaxID=5499 RepID=A0A9Q8LBU4_PASFU|nr:uncharacterized protein CLAFUR5_02900 [Fulvia fulva]KAK4632259.1 hypothetical protein CLAFUR4_02906 [Fulvia fulva]KAK4633752.1 hypothetical protein CLAFUR0_02909 [Fulvia fulva]UJO13883.1 hypothetical protein CLAFUR5_02900 [Fulvia fulva]WPV11380.1 hypothetical protein CLAFUW4_02913 [Fulvia fulva]WPV25604.1 hypothetical protein CLAFUW7_02910 [Fulvia fulva]